MQAQCKSRGNRNLQDLAALAPANPATVGIKDGHFKRSLLEVQLQATSTHSFISRSGASPIRRYDSSSSSRSRSLAATCATRDANAQAVASGWCTAAENLLLTGLTLQ